MRRCTGLNLGARFNAGNNSIAALLRNAVLSALVSVALAACGGGGVSTTDTSASVVALQFSVGGTVSGLSGSNLILENNNGDDLAVAASGSFTFATTLIPGNSYNITVAKQPAAPAQTCVVSNGVGVISKSNVTSVAIVCADKTTTTDSIGGTVVGLTGSGLVLQNDGGDDLAVPVNGAFVFVTPLASGMPYSVSVLTPPAGPNQDCVVANGSGNTVASDINNVTVTCTTNTGAAYTIGGTISGISGGSSIVLQDNGRDNLTLSSDGAFQFATPVPSGSGYNVTSLRVSGQQSATCAFTNANGLVGAANVTNVTIICKANAVVSVTVAGLAGSGLILQDNGTDNLAITQNGATAFATALSSGSTYTVSVATQPSNPTQTCTVSSGTGTAVPGSATPVSVTCTTSAFTVGGTISGLAGSGLVLQDNGGNDLSVPAGSTNYAFPGSIISGGDYSVTILAQPSNPTQTCSIASGAGVIGGANASVAVTCVTNQFTVSGTVSGLTIGAAAGPVLQNNGGASLATANGPFTFPAQLSGTAYDVTVQTQPSGYFCAVGGAAGTVTNADVTNIAVTCTFIGAFLHVTNSGDGTITNFVIDEFSGDLVAAGTVDTGLNPSSIVQGCGVGNIFNAAFYVTNAGDNSVSAYADDAFSGVLTPVPPAVPSGAAPAFIDFASIPGLCLAIALNSGGSSASVYTGALATGALTAVAGSPFATDAAPTAATHTFSGNSILEYIVSKGANEIALYDPDNTTGALNPGLDPTTGMNIVATTGLGPSAVDLQLITVNEVAALFTYVTNQGENSISIYSTDQTFGFLTTLLDPATGTTPLRVATGGGPTAMTIVNNDDVAYYLYVANGADGNLSGYSINLTFGACELSPCTPPVPGTPLPINITGATPPGATIATGNNPVAITQVSLNGVTYLYVVNHGSNSISVFTVDMTNGALREIAGSPFAAGTAPTAEAVQRLPEE
jgi:6-phosphogluconolactonase (cycloisomerase 2 family)